MITLCLTKAKVKKYKSLIQSSLNLDKDPEEMIYGPSCKFRICYDIPKLSNLKSLQGLTKLVREQKRIVESVDYKKFDESIDELQKGINELKELRKEARKNYTYK